MDHGTAKKTDEARKRKYAADEAKYMPARRNKEVTRDVVVLNAMQDHFIQRCSLANVYRMPTDSTTVRHPPLYCP